MGDEEQDPYFNLDNAKKVLMPKKVLMVLTSIDKYPDESATGFWAGEAAHPYSKWTEAGWTVDICSITGTATPDPASVEAATSAQDASAKAFIDNEALYKTTPTLAEIAAKEDLDYDVLFFCGGFGTMWDFPADESVKTITKTMYEAGKIVRRRPSSALRRASWRPALRAQLTHR